MKRTPRSRAYGHIAWIVDNPGVGDYALGGRQVNEFRVGTQRPNAGPDPVAPMFRATGVHATQPPHGGP